MTPPPVIFDLDGTLVDSADGILTSFAAAFEALGLQPLQPLHRGIIGPPLQPTLRLLAGSDDPVLLARLTDAFKAHYDSQGFRQTRGFPGVEDMLSTLCGMQTPLFVATNKRHVPTERIMDMLGWRKYFVATASLDTPQPAAADKAALICHLMHRHSLPTVTLYVGDRADDGVAAAQVGIPFFHATWGYEGDSAGSVSGATAHIATLLQVLRSQKPVFSA